MNGIIIINKPEGFTSQDVVSKVKKILNTKKAGHTGTLDPLATGVLPVLLGEYTKLSKYLIEHEKKYIVSCKLGIRTETGDSEGNVIEQEEVLEKYLDEIYVKNVLKNFLGKQIQTPPMYSAIKVNGKKLYEYARAGEKVDVPTREIEIYDIKLLEINSETSEIVFEVFCSKGTYMRTLCEDIAKKIGTIGFMSSLKRTLVGKFPLEKSVDLDVLEKNRLNEEFLKDNIIKMEAIFNKLPKINLSSKKERLFLNGVMLMAENQDGVYNIYVGQKYLGLGTVKNKLLKRDIIIEE